MFLLATWKRAAFWQAVKGWEREDTICQKKKKLQTKKETNIKPDSSRRNKMSEELGHRRAVGCLGKCRQEHFLLCEESEARGGEAVEGGESQLKKSLMWHDGNFNFVLLGHRGATEEF